MSRRFGSVSGIVFNRCLSVQTPPPFKPLVTTDTDTRYFDSEFTGESVELTPPEHGGPLNSITEEMEQPYFQQFSYHGDHSQFGSDHGHFGMDHAQYARSMDQ